MEDGGSGAFPKADVAQVRTSVNISLQTSGGRVVGQVVSFDGLIDGREHVAVGLGLRRRNPAVPLVRLHSECLTGEVLGSEQCDCGPQLHEAMRRLEQVGGYLLYLRQEGRGIGLYSKLDAYRLQEQGLDTFEANRALGYRDDERDYTPAAQMLHALGVTEVDLLTNNRDKVNQLRASGVAVRSRVSTGLFETPSNGRYLAAKAAAGQRGSEAAVAPFP